MSKEFGLVLLAIFILSWCLWSQEKEEQMKYEKYANTFDYMRDCKNEHFLRIG